jgi:serine protease Do
VRDKKELTLEVQIGERPENLEEGIEKFGSSETGAWRGLEVEDLSSENARRFEIKEKQGVVVVYVEPNTPADEAGLIAGDVILEINKQIIKNLSDYKRITKDLKGDALVKTSRGYFLLKEGA